MAAKYKNPMAPKPWISIPNIKIYYETKFRPNRRIFVFWQPFWIQSGRHSKPTMNINSQHHNLLKMAVIAMGTAKMLKKIKTQKLS
jgi:hypothetical protein